MLLQKWTDAVKKVEDSVVSVINMKEQDLEGFGGVFGSETPDSSKESNLQTIGERKWSYL